MTNLTLSVASTGAVRIICRASGDNSELFKMAAYYFVAQWRFPAEPGRAPFEYEVTVKYMIP